MHKLTVSFLAALLIVPVGVFGQDSIRVESALRLAAMDSPPGMLGLAVPREAARLAKDRPLGSAQQQAQARSWRSRHPILFGTLIGLGGGAGVALATEDCRRAGNGESLCGLYLAGYGGIGAGIGAAVGLIVAIAH